ncbi:MAG: NADH-quinone oxidoreductase subunit M [Motiliproteus sp.]
MLTLLIVLLLAGAVIAWLVQRLSTNAPRQVALATLSIALLLLLPLLFNLNNGVLIAVQGDSWLLLERHPWIPRFGISWLLGMDGMSLLLLLLTLILGLVAIAASWTEINQRQGFFYFNLLACLAGVVGVFTALDLFLFFVFWEVMLIPVYFLIGIWGHENRHYAALKFVIFTQTSSLLMLISIVGLALLHQQQNGSYSFDYFELLGSGSHSPYGFWLMLGFFIAFVVKLPAFPLHTWLADAHTQAPTAGSIILAGVLLKTGAYGLIRFLIPLFPDSLHSFAPVGMTIGVIGIFYGALLAFAQYDLKRLVAYSSISHMGFILLGVYAWNELALQGAVMQMLTHGFSSAALFMLAGAVQQRIHSRDMRQMGGLWSQAPRMAAIALFFAMASLGIPGLGNFIAEFLILIGSFQASVPATVLATLGLVGAAIYALIMIQRVFHGQQQSSHHLVDFDRREQVTMAVMMLALLLLGLYPQPTLDILRPVLDQLQALVQASSTPLVGVIL